ncbi:hypothetical protein CONLIGDRAFT_687668 [Coniochaeta ligniaria NRRL 30616]|uniref:Putative 5'-nucleotidase C-terminal domain-containing protein n=1 Tax=Coniochaeta ligniaria NRRL 30616 TaxID=1408157 RepID=A0A1J7I455_9PEZI|nr:hypothetical protein CONLIGDRAFT_687668 [Coniochaeta ligniaria NRRL 30616]
MTPEEKALQRFTLEKQRLHKKRSMFDLEDDDDAGRKRYLGEEYEDVAIKAVKAILENISLEGGGASESLLGHSFLLFYHRSDDLWMTRSPYPSEDSIYSWLEGQVLPDVVVNEEPEEKSNGHIIFGGSFTGLGNASTPSRPDGQVINLSSATITSGSSSSAQGCSDPKNIGM